MKHDPVVTQHLLVDAIKLHIAVSPSRSRASIANEVVRICVHATLEQLGPLDITDMMVVALINELHSNMPEDQRPMSMMDLSDEQSDRARKAIAVVLAIRGQRL